jgi:prevent-host-death family protein
MTDVNITESRERLPEYLRKVKQGEELVITVHGKAIARLVPNVDPDARQAAMGRLQALRGSMIMGDVLAPSDW